MENSKKSRFFQQSQLSKDSDDENEENDIIAELEKIPKFSTPTLNIPKSNSSSSNSGNKFREIPIYWKGDSGPNLVCLHGAGHSALSFAPLANINKKYRTIAFDYRGHGYNTMSEGEDLSQETLIKDTIQVLYFIEEKFAGESIIIVGHSMGGSIATKTAAEIFKNKDKYPSLYDTIQGLIVIDVVEGTAMDALPFMEEIVRSRPKSFSSIDSSIQYMYKSGTIKNIQSARVSVPPLVKEEEGKEGSYTWKTNLLSSQKYWSEWFEGLTQCFLSVRVPKILLLAASDRMDKDLTIAQMQGKFKLNVINDVGHIVHEDNPQAAYNIIDSFITTFRIEGKLENIKAIKSKLGSSKPKEFVKYDEYKG